MLRVLKDEGRIETWDDAKLIAGQPFILKIDRKLKEADIVLCLFSRDSVASEACNSEVELALKEQKILIPIILKACEWRERYRELARIQALPKSAHPIHSWEQEDEAWLSVAQGIRKVVDNYEEQDKKEQATNDTGTADAELIALLLSNESLRSNPEFVKRISELLHKIFAVDNLDLSICTQMITESLGDDYSSTWIEKTAVWIYDFVIEEKKKIP